MPGLVGIISKTNRYTSEDFKKMIECMLHESFYISDFYENKGLGVHIGWISHKSLFTDCLPIYNDTRTVGLIFTGELFPSDESLGITNSRSVGISHIDPQYLVRLYDEQGDDFIKNLNGWFAGFLIDFIRGRAILFNDRYGIHRLYYYEGEDCFIFSSEAKAILRIIPETREFDMESLGQLFCFGAPIENRSLFSKVKLIPGGSLWRFTKDMKIIKDTYFQPCIWEKQSILGKGDFLEVFQHRIKKIIPRYFASPNPVAISLTGGLDTRMMMAWGDVKPGAAPCFTFGGMYRDCFDIKVARKVAKACGQSYQVIPIDKRFLNAFSSYAEKTIYISDGCLDVCGASEVYVNGIARKIAPTRITGNYGGEVSRSINYIKPNPPDAGLFNPDFIGFLTAAKKEFNYSQHCHNLSYAVFKMIPWLLYGRLVAAQSQLTVRTPYTDNDFVSLMYQAPEDVRSTKALFLRMIKNGKFNLDQIMTDRGDAGNTNFIFSKSARLYFEVLFKLEYYYSTGMPHWLARIDHTIRPFNLEAQILGRHKIDNYRVWFRDELASYVQEILLAPRTLNRPYLNKKFVEKIVHRHISGKYNYVKEINAVLTTELIQRLLMDRAN
jgi:asparagine synthase (glutamine-hydrolysing)